MTVFDSDLRCRGADMNRLWPYLDEGWQGYLRLGPGGQELGSGWQLPQPMFQSARTALRRTAVKDDHLGRSWVPDGVDGDPVAVAIEQLDRDGVGKALLNPGIAPHVSSLWSPHLGAKVAQAANDWLIADWLDADPRFVGSIVVGTRDPQSAAAEIRRVGGDERIVQVVFAYPPALLGNRFLHPVLEAASETGLVVALQAGGAYVGGNRGLTGVGYPRTAYEYALSSEYAAQAHLLSLIAAGTFDRFPGLRVLFAGFGVAWVPSLLWRLETEPDELARLSDLQRSPTEYVRTNVRFTTDPLDFRHRSEEIVSLLSVGSLDELVLYASGERRHPPAVIDALPEAWRQRILARNAEELYRGN